MLFIVVCRCSLKCEYISEGNNRLQILLNTAVSETRGPIVSRDYAHDL